MTVTYADIERAAARIDGIAHHTPVLTSATANESVGAQIAFKAENLQRMGAFKFRGAYNALALIPPARRGNGIIAFSSGNHAQAVALAARLLEMPATIVMPEDAPAIKLAATRGYGATVVTYDRYAQDREEIGRRLADEQGGTLIPPYDHPDVIAGQGTATRELIQETGPLDVLVVPLGGGGLLSGAALAAAALSPGCRVIGVEPEAGNDGQQSFRRGEIVTIATPRTIADGAQTLHLGNITFPIIREFVTDIVTVSDAQLVAAMAFLASRMKIIVEPTGCLAAAAVLSGAFDVRGLRTGVILSGGNIDLDRFSSLVTSHAGD